MSPVCRNCNSSAIIRIENGGVVSPFFAYRVWGIRSIGHDPMARKERVINALSLGLLETTMSKASMYADTVICKDCSFYSVWQEIPDDALAGLYRDYRSDTYNRDRDFYEPGFTQKVGIFVGKSGEASNRVAALEGYFKGLQAVGRFRRENIKNALDWGGADGRFLPDLGARCEKYVLEVSDTVPIKGVSRLDELDESQRFDYIQVAHVLEHLSNPHKFLAGPISHLSERGYLYLEVPLEVTPATLVEDVIAKKINLCIHEHLNKYTEKSLCGLADSHNLRILDVATEDVDFFWYKGTVVRLLAQKDEL